MRRFARAVVLAGAALLALPPVAAVAAIPPADHVLTNLVPECTRDDGVTRVFRVRNPQPHDVPFTYEGTDNELSGGGTAAGALPGEPHRDTVLEVEMPGPGINIRVLVDGVEQRKGRKNANTVPCIPAGEQSPDPEASPSPSAPGAPSASPSPSPSASPPASPSASPSPSAPAGPSPVPSASPSDRPSDSASPPPSAQPSDAATDDAAFTDLDCDDLTPEQAQAILAADASDPHGLDADDDGIPCEVTGPGGKATASAGDGGGLPGTGLATAALAGTGLGLLTAGTGSLYWLRRRRQDRMEQ